MSRLAGDDTRLIVHTVTPAEAQECLRAFASSGTPPVYKDAAMLAEALISGYAGADPTDPMAYLRALIEVFRDYPVGVCRAVADPVHGLPASSVFRPTVAELRRALEAEKARRAKIEAAARTVLEEHEKREAQRRTMEREKAERGTEADRRAAVRRLLGREVK